MKFFIKVIIEKTYSLSMSHLDHMSLMLWLVSVFLSVIHRNSSCDNFPSPF